MLTGFDINFFSFMFREVITKYLNIWKASKSIGISVEPWVKFERRIFIISIFF